MAPRILTGAAAIWAANQYGGPMAVSQSVTPIGNTPTELYPNNPERVWMLLVNLGTDLIHLSYSQDVGAGEAIFLTPNGGFYGVQIREDIIMPTLPHWVVSVGTSTKLFHIEMYRYSSKDLLEADNADII